MTSHSFDISTSRGKFPALRKRYSDDGVVAEVGGGVSDQVYFDNAGGSQTLGTVIDSICSYLSNTNVQLGASYTVGKKSTEKYADGYAAAAKFINAKKENIVLGSSTTQLYHNLSHAFDTTNFLPPGSEIIVSSIDHEANISSWVSLASRAQLTLKWWTPKSTSSSTNPKLLPEDVKALMTPKTRLVTCTHASNILGTIHDIKAIAEVVHEVEGAMLCVDGVAYAPHRGVNVMDLGVDFYCFSWYKVYGPHISMLYASEAGLAAVTSLGHFFNPTATLENRLALAGSSYELVASIPAVLAYLGPPDSPAWEAIEKHEWELQSTLLEYLNSREDVIIIGEKDSDTKKRVATVSFVVNGKGSRDIVEGVDRKTEGKMGIRWGSFYSVRLVEELLDLGKDGVVRVSMVHYNTCKSDLLCGKHEWKRKEDTEANCSIVDEVNRLIEVLKQVLG